MLTAILQVLVAATGHDPRGNLQSVYPSFAEYGVNVTSLERCGKFAFVAVKGRPRRTVSVVRPAASGNAWLVVKVHGRQPPPVSSHHITSHGEYRSRPPKASVSEK